MLSTSNKVREGFHLLFLRRLGERWAGERRPWAVKGGCALRFFHLSPRFSEDLDLDAPGFSVQSLRKGIEEAARAAGEGLAERGMGGARLVSFAKEGQYLLRAKVAVRSALGEVIPTRIEVSRRPLALPGGIAAVPPALAFLSALQAPPFLVPTYRRGSLIALKIAALRGRSLLRVRDVYDLGHLLPEEMPRADLGGLGIDGVALREAALLARGAGVDFEAYRREVGLYLGGERMDRASWDEARGKVAHCLLRWAEDLDAAG